MTDHWVRHACQRLPEVRTRIRSKITVTIGAIARAAWSDRDPERYPGARVPAAKSRTFHGDRFEPSQTRIGSGSAGRDALRPAPLFRSDESESRVAHSAAARESRCLRRLPTGSGPQEPPRLRVRSAGSNEVQALQR